jgi:hypothetical protein
MGIRETLMHAVFSRLLENPAKNKSYEQLIAGLQNGEAVVLARAAGKPDTPQNRAQFGHIIGIEQWCQRRLNTLQGAPAVQDEYDGYRRSSAGHDRAGAGVCANATGVCGTGKGAAGRRCAEDRHRPSQ